MKHYRFVITTFCGNGLADFPNNKLYKALLALTQHCSQTQSPITCIWHEKNIPNFHIPTQLLLGISFFIIITLGLIAFYKQFVSISPTYRESIQIITTLLIIITLMGIAGLYKRTFAIYFSGLTLLTLVYTIGLTLIYADLHNTPLYFHLPSKLGNSVQKQEPLAHEKQSTPIQYCPQITSALHG